MRWMYPGKPGAQFASLEERIYQAVAGMLLNVQADIAEEQLQKKGPIAARLLRHKESSRQH